MNPPLESPLVVGPISAAKRLGNIALKKHWSGGDNVSDLTSLGIELVASSVESDIFSRYANRPSHQLQSVDKSNPAQFDLMAANSKACISLKNRH